MKHAYIHLFLLLFGSTLLDAKEPIVLDLTAQHPQLQTVIDTGVQSKPITEGGTQMVFKPALYEVKIRGGVRFLIDCFYMEYTKTKIKYCSDDSIIPRKERDDHSRLGYLTLQANDMTYEEAQAMSDAFHKTFGLDKAEADKVLSNLKEKDIITVGSYRIAVPDNYPMLSIV